MAKAQEKLCKNCGTRFAIDEESAAFYKRLDVPPPTWCPPCRTLRRMSWVNQHTLHRRRDDKTGKSIYSIYSEESGLTVWNRKDWWSDGWDPLSYGRDIDWNRPFLEQLKELMREIPRENMSATNVVNSDYCSDCKDFKNCYLAFTGARSENLTYSFGGSYSKDSMDLLEVRESELCYEVFDALKCYRVFFSAHVQSSRDVWFSRNLVGCDNCFMCVNLKNKSYHIGNVPYSPANYKKALAEYTLGSFSTLETLLAKAKEFWAAHPVRFMEGFQNMSVSGNYINHSKNTTNSFFIIDGHNNKNCYRVSRSREMEDITQFGAGSELMYECAMSGEGHSNTAFCWDCFTNCRNIRYCMYCRDCSHSFGCIGLRSKKYCILNKQYGKKEYEELLPKVTGHMNALPYRDASGREYRFGEFFPSELSPFAYNETLAYEYFPRSAEGAAALGMRWHTFTHPSPSDALNPHDLPDNIRDVSDDITKKVISCAHEGSCGDECTLAFRIIPQELRFYRNIGLPLPRLCVSCRYARRAALRLPPVLLKSQCMCQDPKNTLKRVAKAEYKNAVPHSHGSAPCRKPFETAWPSDTSEIVYCEACYREETS
jgi:hypothetical protein